MRQFNGVIATERMGWQQYRSMHIGFIAQSLRSIHYYCGLGNMIQTIITSMLAFASTNVDDIFILMLFFGSRANKPSTIFAGQYLGIGALLIISLVGAVIGNFVDQRYIGLLGLFPIYLAIKQVMELLRKGDHAEDHDVAVKSVTALSVAGVTIANGADNIGVYVPLLTTMDLAAKIQLTVVFMVMVYLWCAAGKYLATHPLIARRLEKYGHVITPVVLFLIGGFILVESGSLSLLTD
jgi:cadmium resistance protein CadD (predicted permease)